MRIAGIIALLGERVCALRLAAVRAVLYVSRAKVAREGKVYRQDLP